MKPERSMAGWYWIGGWAYYLSDAVAKRSIELYPDTVRPATQEELENCYGKVEEQYVHKSS